MDNSSPMHDVQDERASSLLAHPSDGSAKLSRLVITEQLAPTPYKHGTTSVSSYIRDE